MAISHAHKESLFRQSIHAVNGMVRDIFAGIGNAIILTASANDRLRQAEILNAKSYEELQAMGLKREDITRYVFRDIFYV